MRRQNDPAERSASRAALLRRLFDTPEPNDTCEQVLGGPLHHGETLPPAAVAAWSGFLAIKLFQVTRTPVARSAVQTLSALARGRRGCPGPCGGRCGCSIASRNGDGVDGSSLLQVPFSPGLSVGR